MTRRRAGWMKAALACSVAAVGMGGHAEPLIGQSRGTFGLPGLIDMPTAESAPDGMLATSLFFSPVGTRGTLSFQISDRLTGAFRYSSVPGIGTGGTDLYDRSFDIHYRLFDETRFTPAIAVGLRDFVGTGIYSSEYLVATKSLTPRLRATAGLRWGGPRRFGGLGSPLRRRAPEILGQFRLRLQDRQDGFGQRLLPLRVQGRAAVQHLHRPAKLAGSERT